MESYFLLNKISGIGRSIHPEAEHHMRYRQVGQWKMAWQSGTSVATCHPLILSDFGKGMMIAKSGVAMPCLSTHEMYLACQLTSSPSSYSSSFDPDNICLSLFLVVSMLYSRDYWYLVIQSETCPAFTSCHVGTYGSPVSWLCARICWE